VDETEKLYAALGRRTVQHDDLDRQYTKLLNVLAAVISGAIAPSRVLVNMTDRSWAIAPPGDRPGLPATVNGLPVCIVAPDPPPSPESPEA